MRNPILYLCSLALILTGCGSDHVQEIRTREVRSFPNPTLGTDNPESQWYKTQILAAPSAATSPTSAGSAGAPVLNMLNKPARSAAPVPTIPAAPNTKAGKTGI